MKTPDEHQEKLLHCLKEYDPAIRIEWDEAEKRAKHISGNLGTVPATDSWQALAEWLTEDFLVNYSILFGPPDLPSTLRLLPEKPDDLGVKFFEFDQLITFSPKQSRESEFEIFCGKLHVEVSSNNTLRQVLSSCLRDTRMDYAAIVTVDRLQDILLEAISQASNFLPLREDAHLKGREIFPILRNPHLFAQRRENGRHLTWQALTYGTPFPAQGENPDARPGIAHIDAVTGKIIAFVSSISHEDQFPISTKT